MNITLEAPAKINLYLDIVSKKENGYHNIKGVMQKISLCDKVSVALTRSHKNEITVKCSEPSVPEGRDNIAYKAAELYLESFTLDTYKVNICIEKHIPAAGGLAGGSTDAAAVLSAMHTLLGEDKGKEKLLQKSAELGADVPFCLADGAMITEGIGETLTPCPALADCTVVLCNTGEIVSTPAAYRQLDIIYNDFKNARFDSARFSNLLDGLSEKSIAKISGAMFNIFEQTVLAQQPKAANAKSVLLSCGADGAMMSGSGPSVFGLFSDERKAHEAHRILCELGYTCHNCKPIG